jgi:hypothetical protein
VRFRLLMPSSFDICDTITPFDDTDKCVVLLCFKFLWAHSTTLSCADCMSTEPMHCVLTLMFGCSYFLPTSHLSWQHNSGYANVSVVWSSSSWLINMYDHRCGQAYDTSADTCVSTCPGAMLSLALLAYCRIMTLYLCSIVQHALWTQLSVHWPSVSSC